MSFRFLLLFLLILPYLGIAATRPNILFIVVDDQGYSDVGIDKRAYDVKTPGMDRLAENGVRFSQAYASASICSAARCGLITGSY